MDDNNNNNNNIVTCNLHDVNNEGQVSFTFARLDFDSLNLWGSKYKSEPVINHELQLVSSFSPRESSMKKRLVVICFETCPTGEWEMASYS